MAIIPNEYVPETMNNGNATASNISALYPKEHVLHRYIADTCGMRAVSYGAGITDAVAEYASNVISPEYQFEMEFDLLPDEEKIANSIRANRPTLITTTIVGEPTFHTMCVYGYRDTDDDAQLLVHYGWWSNNEHISGSSYVQKMKWVNECVATYGYFFSYTNPLASYNDIPRFNTWSFPGIFHVVTNRIMMGTTSTSFSPNQHVTRAMFVNILYRMAGSPAVTYSNIYTDVPANQWYTNCIYGQRIMASLAALVMDCLIPTELRAVSRLPCYCSDTQIIVGIILVEEQIFQFFMIIAVFHYMRVPPCRGQ